MDVAGPHIPCWITNLAVTSQYRNRTPSIIALCWSILIKSVVLIPMSINTDHCWSITLHWTFWLIWNYGIERNWSAVIGYDWHSEVLGNDQGSPDNRALKILKFYRLLWIITDLLIYFLIRNHMFYQSVIWLFRFLRTFTDFRHPKNPYYRLEKKSINPS